MLKKKIMPVVVSAALAASCCPALAFATEDGTVEATGSGEVTESVVDADGSSAEAQTEEVVEVSEESSDSESESQEVASEEVVEESEEEASIETLDDDATEETVLTFSDSEITAAGGSDGYKIEDTELTINASGTYVVTGSCADGGITVKKGTTGVVLVLRDLTLGSSTGAPLCCNKTTEVTVQVEGAVTLTDNENAADEDSTDETVADAFEGAAIKAKSGSVLTITGTGTLNVDGSNCKNGIKGAATAQVSIGADASDTVTVNVSAANNGVASDGSVAIEGGTLTVTAVNDGIKAEPDDDDTESAGIIDFNGGTVSVTATGDGVQSTGTTTVNGGTISIDSGDDGIHADADVDLLGGDVTIAAADDGVKAEYGLTIGAENATSGPTITVAEAVEGLEGATVDIHSGTVNVTASDDGINAANSDLTTYDFALNITGGTVWIDAGGDGLDSNGTIDVPGGYTEVFGSANEGNCALAQGDTGSWSVSGGTIIGVGMAGMAEVPTSGTYVAFGATAMGGGMQPGGIMPMDSESGGSAEALAVGAQASSVSISAGSSIVIKDASGNTVYSGTGVKSANSVVFSSASLTQGTTYTLYVNGTQQAQATAQAGNGNAGGMQPGQEGEQPVVLDIDFTRLAGSDRYETAAKIAETAFTGTCDVAIVASGQNYPDALSATALAGAYDCPIILTGSTSLSSAAQSQLSRLGVSKVYLMGGEAAISEDVADAIEGMEIDVQRVAGENRQETSMEVMEQLVSDGYEFDTVIVASGQSFPDALSIGPWAYANNVPILLAGSTGLSDEQIEAIASTGTVKNVIIVGGTAVVPSSVETQLADYSITRLEGADRYQTSQKIAEWELGQGMSLSSVIVASGSNYPDALAGSALAGSTNTVLLLVGDTPTGAGRLLSQAGTTTGYVLGGTAAVSDQALNLLLGIMGGDPGQQGQQPGGPGEGGMPPGF